MTPNTLGSLVIGSGTHNGNTVTTAGSGFTMLSIPTEDSNTHQPLAMEYQVLSGTQQIASKFNLATSYPWTMNGVIFKPSSLQQGGEEASIFTNQVPFDYPNESGYELGTKFWTDTNGKITQARIYTNAIEGGVHSVSIWRVRDSALLAGPYTWNIASGTSGWRAFTLPTPLVITANTDYIVTVSNSNDHYYAAQDLGFDTPIVNGHLHTYTGSGVYTDILGTMPTLTWQNSNYFRDIVFIPGDFDKP